MKKQAGLWIDHRKAVIVTLSDEGETTTKIASNMEKHVRFTGGTASEDGSTEDVRDRQFGNRLNSYYDGVVAALRGAESILIFGPGEAKGELGKRLEHEGLEGRIHAVESADKMTDRQIAARVRDHFRT
jgi:hypothetical protein